MLEYLAVQSGKGMKKELPPFDGLFFLNIIVTNLLPISCFTSTD